ncbi:hypothetical protein H310_10892 [Aphanomyces invadans]|uniref:Amine oxidase domain-containing protein n=1 Tax=Aphanomyces invadans TaxID=157072 RepID=A0A024TPB9_9STRA|nr:hypothetical protein H310_10892 [Aphanomyces invadans]ETV95849.1 hypothetical protein H310_10892 [Aphanomyces invadans]|eukprot:XP_008875600.1 hypothetical protein H310_10892 [Aphanomyces invadans]
MRSHQFLVLTSVILGVLESLVSGAPTIPLSKTSRIVIVGGGPAGVHYSSLLAKKGFTNIRVLEATMSVGGSRRRSPIPTESPTSSEYDPTNTKFPFAFEKPNYLYTMGKSAGAEDSDPTTVRDFPHYLLRSIQENAPAGFPSDASPEQLIALFQEQAVRYITLHRQILGNYEYGLPPEPKDWSLIDMPAMEFLKANNLTALTGMFRFSQQQQGYGVLEHIPTLYLMWWSHPQAVSKILTAQVTKSTCAYQFTRGFQSIWKAISKAHRNNIQTTNAAHPTVVQTTYDATVTSITRGLDGVSERKLSYKTKAGNSYDVEFDHLVMAVDLSLYASLITDLTAEEREILIGTYTASTFVTTLFDSRPSPVETAGMIWHYRMTEGGRLSALRNTKLAFQYQSSSNWGNLINGHQTRIAYQYYDQPLAQVAQNTVMPLLRTDLKLAGMLGITMGTTRRFNYFPRFTQEGLKKGLPWKILDMQFDHMTTWIGSSVCFESALDVVTYNNNLIKRVHITE